MSDKVRLFYDGSCKLCRHEINYLSPKLRHKATLVDISAEGFTGFEGIGKSAMMAQIHLWDGSRFIIGLAATLYYWRLAGMRFLPWLLELPVVNPLANKAYQYWARKRARCTDNHCDLR
ncbi:thiol-disulfide oxidoreductase DCC family protein [Alishewanella sp. d11]|uniref:thiol-disulfide oxidoreductase DCC family protein n=1 Tax=Alishewanella sp. d11 TaxID=3414030 RepID=UPI003BF7C2A7